jgi:hypothetical protein
MPASSQREKGERKKERKKERNKERQTGEGLTIFHFTLFCIILKYFHPYSALSYIASEGTGHSGHY